MEIQEIKANKLLADFVGHSVREFEDMLCMCKEDESPWDYNPIQWYRPNECWNQLMEIVDKIGRELGYRVIITTTFTRINIGEGHNIECRNLYNSITCTWLAVVRFVQWYNNTPKHMNTVEAKTLSSNSTNAVLVEVLQNLELEKNVALAANDDNYKAGFTAAIEVAEKYIKKHL